MEQSPFKELFGVTSLQTLQFFFDGLREVVSESVRKEDFFYPASILAHYAQVSCASTNGFSCPRTLIDVYENFVSPGNPALTRSKLDLGICEIAGGQCLFLSGFFERELQSRHNIRWYIYNGRRFYTLVAENTVERERGAKMQKMADQFEIWHGAYSSLRRHLRESQYILNLPTSES